MSASDESVRWHRVSDPLPDVGEVELVVVDGRAICLARIEAGYGALDNRCPHQGGPLGEGAIEGGFVVCPWHGYEYDPVTGAPPDGYGDRATAFPVRVADDGIEIALEERAERRSIMDAMVETMTRGGVDTVFGMVGHSNLGLAEALRKAEARGDLVYIGIRHEGAAAFAASAYGKLTGRPAACFTIAGPGATNLMTGLWDAKVDRAPVLALTGQVGSQVLGPGAFQEIPLADAFAAVAAWSQTVLVPDNAVELMALALKHAIVERDVAHLIFPDEVQARPIPEHLDVVPADPLRGRVAGRAVAPPEADLARAVELIAAAERPVLIVGNGGRADRARLVAFAERLDMPILTTFKAKGAVDEAHPLGTGVLGRSGTPVASAMMAGSDLLVVAGASFAVHTGISEKKPAIQIDLDRMTIGKFHPVEVGLWGEIARTVDELTRRLPGRSRPDLRAEMAERKERWRREKRRRAAMVDERGRMHPAAVFEALSAVVPTDAVLPVDVGNNTYAFGHYFVASGDQDVLMSGYLGSIGFALPAALGAWAATRGQRKVVSISGDGGLGQYLAEFTTAVKYQMGITHVVLDNGELAKISREQIADLRPVWQTSLVNPDFATFADMCNGRGFRVGHREELVPTLEAAIAHDGPSMVVVETASRWI